MRSTSFLAALAFVAALSTAGADHGDPNCEAAGVVPVLGIVQFTSGSADATFYVDDRGYVDGNGIWLYQEGNAVWNPKAAGVYFGDPHHDDLQRGDSCDIVPDGCEICTDPHPAGPDYLIF